MASFPLLPMQAAGQAAGLAVAGGSRGKRGVAWLSRAENVDARLSGYRRPSRPSLCLAREGQAVWFSALPLFAVWGSRASWLVLLAALFLVLLVAWRRGLVVFSPWRRVASLAARMLVVCCLVGALAGLQITRLVRRQCIVVLVDRSPRIGELSRRSADRFAQRLRRQAADVAVTMLSFGEARAGPGGEGRTGRLGEGSELAAALRSAATRIEPGCPGRIVLFSDGITGGQDPVAVARLLGVPVFPKPLEGRAGPEVCVDRVRVPAEVPAGQPFPIDVVVRSDGAGQGAVTLLCQGRLVGRRPLRVAAGVRRVRFVHALPAPGGAVYTARLADFPDTLTWNNAASAAVIVTPPPKVLVVESQPGSARALAQALEAERMGVAVGPADELPGSPDELDQYALVCLCNVPAQALGPGRMDAIRRYVRRGGGLVVVGGPQAFTPGGYRGTALERLLPVRCQFRRKPRRRSVAMVLVIDSSGSMQGNAIRLAQEATRRAIDLLEPQDQVGVIAFENQSRWISPIRPCSDRGEVLERIDTIRAGGGTDLFSAMDKAYLALDEAFAERKHMIVLTDGISHPGDFDGLVREIGEAGITVSTVAVGDEAADELLEAMAQQGGGHFYYCDDPADVPEIFVLETAAATRMGIIEEPFRPRAVGFLSALAAVGLDRLPPLLGYVETRAEAEAQVVLATEAGHPLLAWWRYGRGITVAFTSDVQGRWAPAWLEWSPFTSFWTGLIRFAMREKGTEGFALRASRQGRYGIITLDAVDAEQRFVNGAEATVAVVDPAGHTTQLAAPQVAPGRYEARFPMTALGAYFVEFRLAYRGRAVYMGRRGLTMDWPHDDPMQPADYRLLRRLAEASGGQYDPDVATLVAKTGARGARSLALWPHLLAAAAVLWAVDVGLRRVNAWPPWGKGNSKGPGVGQPSSLSPTTQKMLARREACPPE